MGETLKAQGLSSAGETRRGRTMDLNPSEVKKRVKSVGARGRRDKSVGARDRRDKSVGARSRRDKSVGARDRRDKSVDARKKDEPVESGKKGKKMKKIIIRKKLDPTQINDLPPQARIILSGLSCHSNQLMRSLLLITKPR